MTERTHLASEPVHAATRQLQSIVELLDILWEQARGQTPPLHPRLTATCDVHRRPRGRHPHARPHPAPGRSAPSVSRLIDRLQAMGFVERGACPGSRREVLLSITPMRPHPAGPDPRTARPASAPGTGRHALPSAHCTDRGSRQPAAHAARSTRTSPGPNGHDALSGTAGRGSVFRLRDRRRSPDALRHPRVRRGGSLRPHGENSG